VVVVVCFVVVAVPVPAGVSTVVDLVVSVVEEEGGVDGVVETVVFDVDVSGAFSFTTVVEEDVPELAGVVETSVLQPASPRASRRATA
jgi:hypothetical protein